MSLLQKAPRWGTPCCCLVPSCFGACAGKAQQSSADNYKGHCTLKATWELTVLSIMTEVVPVNGHVLEWLNSIERENIYLGI